MARLVRAKPAQGRETRDFRRRFVFYPFQKRQFTVRYAGVSVVAWDGATAHARVYAAGAGVPEDPATGSAAVALGAYLVVGERVAGDGETSYDVVQGVEMGRPSLLHCAVVAKRGRPVETRVSGSTVPIARGEIRVPT